MINDVYLSTSQVTLGLFFFLPMAGGCGGGSGFGEQMVRDVLLGLQFIKYY